MPYDLMQDVSNAVLLQHFAEGNAMAARVLTTRLLPRVLTHATRLLGNRADAEDIAQEAMLRLWTIAPEWREGEAQVTTWLYRVVGNLCVDRLRKRGREMIGDVSEIRPMPDTSPGAEAMMQEQARANALQAALLQLPERQRQAVVLRHLEGLGNPEIGTIMETSVEAVESLIARGRRALIRILQDQKEALGVWADG